MNNPVKNSNSPREGSVGAWFIAAMAMGLSRLAVENFRPIDFDTLGYAPVLLKGRVPEFWQHAGLGFAYIPYLILHEGGMATLTALQINFALVFVLNAILYAWIAFFLFRRGDAALFFGGLYCIFPAHQFLLASLEDNIPVHAFILAPLALLAFAYQRPAPHGEKRRRLPFSLLTWPASDSWPGIASSVVPFPMPASRQRRGLLCFCMSALFSSTRIGPFLKGMISIFYCCLF